MIKFIFIFIYIYIYFFMCKNTGQPGFDPTRLPGLGSLQRVELGKLFSKRLDLLVFLFLNEDKLIILDGDWNL